MLLWFAGLSFAVVWQVFHDTEIDYRLVMAGALLPDAVDVWFGGARVLHSLVFSAALLVVVMLVTRGRRSARRRWLAVPIGTFLHLVLDGMWARTHVFWWPFFGWGFERAALPSADRAMALVAVQEIVGLAVLWWMLGGWELRVFVRTGRLRPC